MLSYSYAILYTFNLYSKPYNKICIKNCCEINVNVSKNLIWYSWLLTIQIKTLNKKYYSFIFLNNVAFTNHSFFNNNNKYCSNIMCFKIGIDESLVNLLLEDSLKGCVAV